MKCILLCAGYATRLFPLTENFPKALLTIGDKPLLDYIIDEVNTIKEVDQIYIITNDKYYKHFKEFSDRKNNIKPIEVINDLTSSNEERLGPVGDTIYVIENKKIDDDLLVIAGDNLFTYPLINVINYYKEKRTTVVCSKKLDDITLLKSFAVAKLDSNNKVIDIVEKPSNPQSNIAVYATYVYPKDIIPYFNKCNKEDNFIVYLYKIKDVYAYNFKGECYDVGTHETLDLVKKMYSK